ncbi:hypothetical protein D3C87_715920 [compost metagenome]
MLKVTTKVPFIGPVSLPFIPAAMLATAASLSVMVTAALAVAMVTKPPVTPVKVPLKVSFGSTRLSLLIGTLKVKVVPAAAFARKFSVPLVAV